MFPRGWKDFAFQLGIWFGFLFAYQIVRGIVDQDPLGAFQNGRLIIDFESSIHALVEVARRHQQNIQGSRQLQMLKPVVEDAHRAPEPLLRDAARQIAIRRDEHWNAGQCACQHLRLVARTIDRLEHPLRIADDDHAVFLPSTGVAATEDRRPLAHAV